MVVLTLKASHCCAVFWEMIALIIIHSMSYILEEAVWPSCQCVRCADQRSPDSPRSSPTLSHVCIATDVPCMAGTKKRVYEILASLDS